VYFSPEVDALWQETEAEAFAAGAFLPNITTSESVRALKSEIDPVVAALDHQVDGCAGLPEEKRAAWKAFRGGWIAYRDAPDSGFLGFGTAPLFDTGLAFQAQAKAWQAEIAGACGGPVAPPVVEHDEPHKSDTESIADTARVVVFGLVAVVGGVLALQLIRK
jgi:hypothetical protein